MPLVSTLKFSTQRRRWQGDQDSSALRQLDCEDLADLFNDHVAELGWMNDVALIIRFPFHGATFGWRLRDLMKVIGMDTSFDWLCSFELNPSASTPRPQENAK